MSKHVLKGVSPQEVYLDGKRLTPQRSQQVWNHSPDGFEWGYGGSGPAQLALAVVLEIKGEAKDYQQFKWDVIAKQPQGQPFEVEFEI